MRVDGFRSYARERLLAEIATLGFATRGGLMHRLGMSRTMISIALGANGIGGAIVVDGRLLRGTGAAGEISHLQVRSGGAPCPCGRRGCFAAEIAALAAAHRGGLPRHADRAGFDDTPEALKAPRRCDSMPRSQSHKTSAKPHRLTTPRNRFQ